MKTQLSSIAVGLALLHASDAENTLRRKRTSILAVDDLVKPAMPNDEKDAFGRTLKGSKKGSSGSSSSDESSDSSKRSKSSSTKRSKSMGGKKAKSRKADKHSVKKGNGLLDSFMDELTFAFSMSMSMPTGPSTPTTPTMAPVPPPTPAPVPTMAPAVPTMAPVATEPPAVINPPPQEASKEPTLSPFAVCESLPREEAMEAILVEVTDGPILTNPATPQGMAYRWILNDDPLQIDPCTYPTVLQRYALASLYFATNGEAWVDNTGWLGGAGECTWFGIMCAGDDVISIDLGKFAPMTW